MGQNHSVREGIVMRRPKQQLNWIGIAAIVLGIIVLLSLFLPPGFWWFVLGVGLIVFGLCSQRRSC